MWKTVLAIAGVVVLAVASVALGLFANSEIRKILVVERTPVSRAVALLPGLAAVEGQAEAVGKPLFGPFTHQPCIYYCTLVEREETNSQGSKHWKTVENKSAWTAVVSRDATGAAAVQPDGADFRAPRVHQHRTGNMRYTEYAIRPGDGLFVFGRFDGNRFVASDEVPFVVSALGESEYRSSRGMASFLAICAAMACATFAIYLTCYVFHIHHIFAYLALLAVIVPTWLFAQWLSLTSAQLDFAVRTITVAQAQIAAEPPDTLRSGLLKQTYNDGIQRFSAYRNSLPNRIVAWTRGVGSFDSEHLTNTEMELIRPYPLAARPQARMHAAMGGAGALLGLGLLGGLSWLGFKRLLVKRLVENLPTSPAAGVVVGLTELVGRPRPNGDWLRSRYTNIECAWYRYETKEKRGSGKNAKWVTIESGKVGTPFWIEDQSGQILVDPEGAAITGRQVHYKKSGGRIRQEWVVSQQDELYLLGPAHLRHPDDKALSIGEDDQAQTYLISVEPEYQVMLGYARTGFLMLNVGLVGGTVAVLSLLTLGGFSPFDFFLAALFPLLYLALLVVLFLYNDLVSLRERVRRSLAMIDVALQKRSDLVPKLVQAVRAYLEHEREVQQKLAAMRSGQADSIEQRESLDARQLAGSSAFLALVEKYPELKGNTLMLDLQRSLTALENEIAFARAGYNDAVERYNTRIESVPELFIARLTGFRPFSLLRDTQERTGERTGAAILPRIG